VLQIIDSLRARAPEISVRPAFIELAEPLLPAALADIPADRRAVLVPLLLASGYHDRVDLPAAVSSVRPGTAHANVLGPDRLLAVALVDRLRSAGWRPGDAVVLAAAGSSDPAAIASVHTQATLLRTELTHPPTPRDGTAAGVRVGFGAGAEPTVEQAVAKARAAGAGRVVIAPYLLAPGQFADRLADAGADLVAAPLGAHPAVVELVLQRAAGASTRG
jgi:sirohydrochlorin ferrochelatase